MILRIVEAGVSVKSPVIVGATAAGLALAGSETFSAYYNQSRPINIYTLGGTNSSTSAKMILPSGPVPLI